MGSKASCCIPQDITYDCLGAQVAQAPRPKGAVGTFLRLRNVHIRKWSGNNFLSIFMHSSSWMAALPYYNLEVQSLLLKHNDRVRRGEYNLEFGLHPKFKFVGNGLSNFKHQANAGVFIGAIHLLRAKQNNLQVIIIADRSGSLEVIPRDNIRERLNNMLLRQTTVRNQINTTDRTPSTNTPSTLCFDSSGRFLASIRSVDLAGDKIFFLTNLVSCD